MLKYNVTYTYWIGTEAELIKLFPIMIEMEKRDICFKIISTGQNEISTSKILSIFKNKISMQILSNGPKRKTTISLLVWFLKTFALSLVKIKADNKAVIIIHGDTISTLLGAVIGFLKGFQIAHIEAGLRSFNYLKPFPEEIDRVISSIFVDAHFCPNHEAIKNLKNRTGQKINTQFNTLYDSLITFKEMNDTFDSISDHKYFVFTLHRQENLYDEDFVKKIISLILEKAKDIECVFILHEPTEIKLRQLGLIDLIKNNPNIKVFPRLPYFDFMKILIKSEFLITDGGSNQEETYYLGLPCLVLRNVTERIEGLQHNVLLERFNFQTIRSFFDNYHNFKKDVIQSKERPSKIIVNHLIGQHVE